jgi:general secretion pathway protein D
MSTFDFTDAQATIQFFSGDTSTKFLARPKILTMVNETAEVNLTIDEVVGIKVTAGQNNGPNTYEAERAQTGTKLRVTPQVNPDTKEITLVVQVSDREAKDSGITLPPDNTMTKNIEERSAKNIVRLQNNETLLIGGLIKNTQDQSGSKVPFLGDLPMVGRMFKSKGGINADRELLIFLTPRLVRTGAFLAEGEKFVTREQPDAEKNDSMKVALDKFEQASN